MQKVLIDFLDMLDVVTEVEWHSQKVFESIKVKFKGHFSRLHNCFKLLLCEKLIAVFSHPVSEENIYFSFLAYIFLFSDL